MFTAFSKSAWVGNERKDFFAGLVSSIALLPEVIGFAILAGINPLTALFSSVVTLLVITFFGGRPAMVSAAAGSMALVMASLIATHGIAYMIAATVLAGVFQLIFAYAGIHRLIKFVSSTVMSGFVNALAILIFLAQVQQLPHQSLFTYAIVILSVGLIYILPRFITVVPPALIVILVMTIVSYLMKGQLQTVAELGAFAPLHLSFGLPHIPLNFHTLLIILPTAISLSLVGLLETLLTLPIIDEITESQGDGKQEAKAQGLANIVTGLFGGQAGCAMIGQALITVKSGGRTRLTTLISSLALLVIIFIVPGLMSVIPTAALIGIMITVAVETFDWPSLKILTTFNITESFILILTVAIVVYTHNLAFGVILGVLLSGIITLVKNRGRNQSV